MSDDLFTRLANNAREGADYNKLGIGNHTVAIKSWTVSNWGPTNNKIKIVAEHVILKSDVHKPGEVREWAFFPDSDEYGYENGRIMAYVQTVGACIGDARHWSEINRSMASTNQVARGVIMNVNVAEKTTKKGKTARNAKWAPVTQTTQQVATMRGEIERMSPAPTQAQTAAPPQGGYGGGAPNQGPPPGQGYPTPQGQGGYQPQQGGYGGGAPQYPNQGPPPQQWGQPAPNPTQPAPQQTSWGQPSGTPWGGNGGNRGGQGGGDLPF